MHAPGFFFSAAGAIHGRDCALRRRPFARRPLFSVTWSRLKSYAYLLEGLTIRRVLVVSAICVAAAAIVVRGVLNT